MLLSRWLWEWEHLKVTNERSVSRRFWVWIGAIVIIVDLSFFKVLVSKGGSFKNYDTFTVRSLDG